MICFSDGSEQKEPDSVMIMYPEIAAYQFVGTFPRPITEDDAPVYPAAAERLVKFSKSLKTRKRRRFGGFENLSKYLKTQKK